MDSKKCTSCCQVKPVTDFHVRNKVSKDGTKTYQFPVPRCKPCRNTQVNKQKKERLERGDLNCRFSVARSNAKSLRNLQWTLTKEQWIEMQHQGCFYCDSSLLNIITGSGLDRIDNSQGYTPENTLPCCYSCNSLRGDRLTVEETEIAVQAIIAFRKKPKLKLV